METRTIVIKQATPSSNPGQQLQDYLDEISDLSPQCLTTCFKLSLMNVDIDPPVLKLLVQLLSATLPQGDNIMPSKWNCVFVHQCRFAQPISEDDDIFTAHDIHNLADALATRSYALTLNESPGILDCLLNTPRLEMTELTIHFRNGLTTSECTRLGTLIQSSVTLNELNIDATSLEAPTKLAEGLAAARSLQTLSFTNTIGSPTTAQQRRQTQSDIVVGPGGYGAIARLLQDPHARLKRLNLSGLELNDDQFIAISELLVSSKLEELNASRNNIESRGILEFARLLPTIQYLKKVALRPNPWCESTSGAKECGEALLRGMMQNEHIEYLDSLLGIPQAPLLRHFATLNRAGRKILASTHPVPLGLWSYILERAATTILFYDSSCDVKFQDDKSRADAVFFLLRNSPTIS